MEEILTDHVTPAQFGALVTGLRVKGETDDEIAGLADAMRRHATPVDLGDVSVVDTCGTGGSGAGWFNVSTTAAFVAAGAGAKVAKHGNRGMTRASGSADVLEALGVKLDVAPPHGGGQRRGGRRWLHVRAGVPPSHEVRRAAAP